MTGYLLDTNVFNGMLDGSIDATLLSTKGTLFAMDVQIDELSKTPDITRRAKLHSAFAVIHPTSIRTEPAGWGVSSWDQAMWNAGDDYGRLLARLNELQRKPNNRHDALIAEAAIKNALVLVTNDRDLAQVAHEQGGRAITLDV